MTQPNSFDGAPPPSQPGPPSEAPVPPTPPLAGADQPPQPTVAGQGAGHFVAGLTIIGSWVVGFVVYWGIVIAGAFGDFILGCGLDAGCSSDQSGIEVAAALVALGIGGIGTWWGLTLWQRAAGRGGRPR